MLTGETIAIRSKDRRCQQQPVGLWPALLITAGSAPTHSGWQSSIIIAGIDVAA
jgi:hypothetical protein